MNKQPKKTPKYFLDPSDYFLNDAEKCVQIIEDKIKEVVSENPLITTKSALSRIKTLSPVTEDIKNRFTKALCVLIENNEIEVTGFVKKQGKF
jgi:hypothetical protein